MSGELSKESSVEEVALQLDALVKQVGEFGPAMIMFGVKSPRGNWLFKLTSRTRSTDEYGGMLFNTKDFCRALLDSVIASGWKPTLATLEPEPTE